MMTATQTQIAIQIPTATQTQIAIQIPTATQIPTVTQTQTAIQIPTATQTQTVIQIPTKMLIKIIPTKKHYHKLVNNQIQIMRLYSDHYLLA